VYEQISKDISVTERGNKITLLKIASRRVLRIRTILCLLLAIPGVAQAAQCIALPDYRPFGDIGTDDWDKWTDLDEIIFSAQNSFLAVEMIADGNRTLRHKFQPSYEGSPRVGMRGKLPESRGYRLRQRVFFEHGFDWGGTEEHGKFGFSLSGGSVPTGGSQDTDGFSARLVWRGAGDGTAKLALYNYFADKNNNFGIDFPTGYKIPIGEWVDIVTEISMNTNHWSSDGSARVFINGSLSMEQQGIRWWSSGKEPAIDSLSYSGFYGGFDSRWAPGHETYMRIANVCWEPTNESELAVQTPPALESTGAETYTSPVISQIDTRFAQTQQFSLRQRVENAREIARLMRELTNNDQTMWWLGQTDIDYADALLDYQWESEAIPSLNSNLLIELKNSNTKIEAALNADSYLQPLTSIGNRLKKENAEISLQLSKTLLQAAQTRFNQWNCQPSSTGWPCNSASSHLSEGQRSQINLRIEQRSSVATTEFAQRIWEASKATLYLLP